jgi:hypothetical protein
MKQAEIATALGISEPTLRRYYGADLETGPAIKRAEVLDQLARAARAGNVTAQRDLLARIDQASLDRLGHELRTAPADDKPKAEPLGKKLQADLAARDVVASDDDWASVLRPRAH